MRKWGILHVLIRVMRETDREERGCEERDKRVRDKREGKGRGWSHVRMAQ